MDQGKIIASGSKDELVETVSGKSELHLVLESADGELLNTLEAINGIDRIEQKENELLIRCENADMILADILSAVLVSGNHLISIDVKKPNLEAVFLYLTGKALRD